MLNGKIAIVTGGTRGIGLAVVRTFLHNGAKVALFGSREASVQRALAQLREEQPNWSVMGLWPDLTDYAAVEQAVQEVAQTFGGVDILVNNAGISAREPLADYSPEAFRSIMDLNVTAVFHGCKAVEPLMRPIRRAAGKGCIINTSSMVSLYGQPSGVGYPTSKFAVNGLTRSLARELGRAGIRVNAVAPGVTRTDMVAALPKELIDRIYKMQYSGGSQVQGHEAMEALRGLIYAPVALAIQSEVNEELVRRLIFAHLLQIHQNDACVYVKFRL